MEKDHLLWSFWFYHTIFKGQERKVNCGLKRSRMNFQPQLSSQHGREVLGVARGNGNRGTQSKVTLFVLSTVWARGEVFTLQYKTYIYSVYSEILTPEKRPPVNVLETGFTNYFYSNYQNSSWFPLNWLIVITFSLIIQLLFILNVKKISNKMPIIIPQSPSWHLHITC